MSKLHKDRYSIVTFGGDVHSILFGDDVHYFIFDNISQRIVLIFVNKEKFYEKNDNK